MSAKRCAVIGDPATHSLSPAIHRAGYALHGLDWSYEALTVPAGGLDEFLRPLLGDPTWVGLSVTAPHKEAVVAYGDPDEPTRLVGGGNTLVFGGQPRVHNTDVPGFVAALRAHGIRSVRSATIVGAGATARSILLACAAIGVRMVEVLVRDPVRARRLAELAETLGVECLVQGLDELPGRTDLLANTIPASATVTHAGDWAARTTLVFDVVYDPWPTPLGRAAAALGTTALSGLDLLAGQAVDQFALLTGRRVTFDVCRSAAEQELRRRRGV